MNVCQQLLKVLGKAFKITTMLKVPMVLNHKNTCEMQNVQLQCSGICKIAHNVKLSDHCSQSVIAQLSTCFIPFQLLASEEIIHIFLWQSFLAHIYFIFFCFRRHFYIVIYYCSLKNSGSFLLFSVLSKNTNDFEDSAGGE